MKNEIRKKKKERKTKSVFFVFGFGFIYFSFGLERRIPRWFGNSKKKSVHYYIFFDICLSLKKKKRVCCPRRWKILKWVEYTQQMILKKKEKRFISKFDSCFYIFFHLFICFLNLCREKDIQQNSGIQERRENEKDKKKRKRGKKNIFMFFSFL